MTPYGVLPMQLIEVGAILDLRRHPSSNKERQVAPVVQLVLDQSHDESQPIWWSSARWIKGEKEDARRSCE